MTAPERAVWAQSESTFAYFDALERYLQRHGKLVAFYSDKHSIFRVARQDATKGDGMPQFGRALTSLNIEILCGPRSSNHACPEPSIWISSPTCSRRWHG